MTFLQALVLGLVQGVTEFLPVSSSAHLILVPRFLGWTDQGLAFDVVTHGGTLLAVLAYFRRDLAQLLAGLWRPRPGQQSESRRLALALIVATAPVAVAGLLLHDWIATAARQPRAVAIPLAVFGVVLWAVDRWAPPGEVVPAPHLGRALAVGCAQALALWPGTSRSGITMTAARGLRFDRTSAARFSFLLSIPATGLAFAADLVDLMRAPVLPVGLPFLIVGFLAAAVSGFAVIAWLLRWVSRHGFLPFAMYRVALAAVILWAL